MNLKNRVEEVTFKKGDEEILHSYLMEQLQSLKEQLQKLDKNLDKLDLAIQSASLSVRSASMAIKETTQIANGISQQSCVANNKGQEILLLWQSNCPILKARERHGIRIRSDEQTFYSSSSKHFPWDDCEREICNTCPLQICPHNPLASQKVRSSMSIRAQLISNYIDYRTKNLGSAYGDIRTSEGRVPRFD